MPGHPLDGAAGIALGAAAAGGGLTLVALTSMDALPGSLVSLFVTLAALLCALAWLPYLALRRLRGAPARPAPGAIRLGILATAGALLVLNLAAGVLLRRMAIQAALVADEPLLTSALSPLLFALVAAAATAAIYWALRSRPAAVVAAAALPPVLGLGMGVVGWEEGLSDARSPAVAEVIAAGEGAGAPTRVILGVDGVGADAFERFREHMPSLSAFADEAARGRLVPAPPMLSPAIWTSVSTGLPSSEHGVANYELFADRPGVRTFPIDGFYNNPSQALTLLPVVVAWRLDLLSVLPSTRLHRKGSPFWQPQEAGGQAGGGERVGLVCWPATWPAEPVDGVLITDRWPTDRKETLFHYRSDLPARTWPLELTEALAPYHRESSEAPDPALLELASLTEREIEALKAAVEDDMGLPKDQPFSNLFYAWITDRSCADAARWVVEEVRPDVLAVYFGGSDLVGHAFFPTEDCQVAGFDADESARLCPLYGDYLRRLDEDLGWLLQVGAPGATTVVLSDHGMQVEETSLFGAWHSGDGFVMARGPGFTAGADLGREPSEGWNTLLTGGE